MVGRIVHFCSHHGRPIKQSVTKWSRVFELWWTESKSHDKCFLKVPNEKLLMNMICILLLISLVKFHHAVLWISDKAKSRGKRSRAFSEGWVEFLNKKVAKRVAASLNNTLIGGRIACACNNSLNVSYNICSFIIKTFNAKGIF